MMKRWQYPSPGWKKLNIDGYLNTLTNIKQIRDSERQKTYKCWHEVGHGSPSDNAHCETKRGQKICPYLIN
jgi:hypothetical protein